MEIKSNKILFIIIFLINVISFAYAIDLSTTSSEKTISNRCSILLENRSTKILQKQKTQALIVRNEKLQNIYHNTKDKNIHILDIRENLKRLKRELKLIELKIQKLTEDVVLAGCPGVTL